MRRSYPNVSFFERRIKDLFGVNSMAIDALDLVMDVMNLENGFKRDDGSDYYTHCVAVANTLLNYQIHDRDAICAALLHDIVEDVEGYNRVILERLFNANVARLVMLLTKEHDKDYHIPENLKEYIEAIKTDPLASVIKTADRMHNMMTLKQKTFESKHRKAVETRDYYLPFFEECSKLYVRYEDLFYAAADQIESHIYTIESMYGEITRLTDLLEEHQIDWKVNPS